MCAFIGQRRKGLPESPSVIRGGAAVLGEAGLQTVKDMAVHLYGKVDVAFRTVAPHLRVRSRGVVAGAWDLLCSDGITTNDNKLPPLCHPKLAWSTCSRLWATSCRNSPAPSCPAARLPA